MKPKSLAEATSAVGITLLVFIIIMILFNTDQINTDWITADFHTHSNYSDGKWTTAQNADWHARQGYDAMFLTDHVFSGNDSFTSPHSVVTPDILQWNANNHLQIFPSAEWTSLDVHILMLNIQYWNLTVPNHPTLSDISNATTYCHSQGGLAIVAHPAYLLNNFNMSDLLTTAGCDGIEVYNPCCGWYDASAYNCIKTVGTDSHDSVPIRAVSRLSSPNIWQSILNHEITNVPL